jgi:hypothetical protein
MRRGFLTDLLLMHGALLAAACAPAHRARSGTVSPDGALHLQRLGRR